MRNWYADPEVGEAQALLAGSAATALAGHEAVWAWDLGNENSNCVIPPSRASARDWLAANDDRRSARPTRLRWSPSACTWRTWRKTACSARRKPPRCATSSPCTGTRSTPTGPMGPTDEHVLSFLARLTRWLGGGSDVLFSEFGLPTSSPGRPCRRAGQVPVLVDEQAAAAYTGRALSVLSAGGVHRRHAVVLLRTTPRAIWARPPLDVATHERFVRVVAI